MAGEAGLLPDFNATKSTGALKNLFFKAPTTAVIQQPTQPTFTTPIQQPTQPTFTTPIMIPLPSQTALGSPLPQSPPRPALPTQTTLLNVNNPPRPALPTQTTLLNVNKPPRPALPTQTTLLNVNNPPSPRPLLLPPRTQENVMFQTPGTAVVGMQPFVPIQQFPVTPMTAVTQPPIIPGSPTSPAMFRASTQNVSPRRARSLLRELVEDVERDLSSESSTQPISMGILGDDDDDDENIFREDDDSSSSLEVKLKPTKRSHKRLSEVEPDEAAIVTPKKGGRKKATIEVKKTKVDVVSVKTKGGSTKTKVVTPKGKRGSKTAEVKVGAGEVVVVTPKKGRKKSVDIVFDDDEVSVVKTPTSQAKKSPIGKKSVSQQLAALLEEEEEEESSSSKSSTTSLKKKSPRKKKVVEEEEEEEEESVSTPLIKVKPRKVPAKQGRRKAKTDNEQSDEEDEEQSRSQSAKPRRKKKSKAEEDSQEYEDLVENIVAHIPKGRGKWKALIPLEYNPKKAEKKIEMFGRPTTDPKYNPEDNPDGSESDDNPDVNQYLHYRELGAILSRVKFAFSASETGVGKTFVTGRLYATMRNSQRIEPPHNPPIVKMLVVGPASSIIAWNELCAMFNIPGVEFISYNSLASKVDSQPNHPYLERFDEHSDDGKKTKTRFEITDKFKKVIKEGVLLVFDEAHRAKGNGQQSKACRELSAAVIDGGGYSRVLFLTATPFDKKEQAVTFFKVFGIFTSSKLFVTHDGRKLWKKNGIGQIAQKCASLDEQATNQIIKAYKLDTDKPKITLPSSVNIVYDFYKMVITKHLIRSIRKPKLPPNLEPVFRNLFLHLKPEEEQEYIHATDRLADELNRAPGKRSKGRTAIPTEVLVAIERSKVKSVARLITWYLNTYRSVKLIVYQNYVNDNKKYKGNLNYLIEDCKKKGYGYVKYTGDMDADARATSVHKFNNDPNIQVFFGSTGSGKESLSLHETKNPKCNRVMLISPSFHFTDSIQAAGRVNRRNMVSRPYVLFTYGGVDGKPHGMEIRYLDTNAHKTAVMKGSIQEEVAGEFMFPGDYKSWVDTGDHDAKGKAERFKETKWTVHSK